jgi:hypothetical protein
MINCADIDNCKTAFNQRKLTLIDPKAASKSNCLIENNTEKEFSKIEFEQCVFNNSNHLKCDYGIEIKDESIFYIELKGSDNNQGLKQLLETVTRSLRCYSSYNKEAILICSVVQKPENLDKITFRKLTKLIGKEPKRIKNSYTINI